MLFWFMRIHLDMPIYAHAVYVHRILSSAYHMRNHADMHIFLRSCVTGGNRNTRNRIQEIA